jgi:hypothetical protein
METVVESKVDDNVYCWRYIRRSSAAVSADSKGNSGGGGGGGGDGLFLLSLKMSSSLKGMDLTNIADIHLKLLREMVLVVVVVL